MRTSSRAYAADSSRTLAVLSTPVRSSKRCIRGSLRSQSLRAYFSHWMSTGSPVETASRPSGQKRLRRSPENESTALGLVAAVCEHVLRHAPGSQWPHRQHAGWEHSNAADMSFDSRLPQEERCTFEHADGVMPLAVRKNAVKPYYIWFKIAERFPGEILRFPRGFSGWGKRFHLVPRFGT